MTSWNSSVAEVSTMIGTSLFARMARQIACPLVPRKREVEYHAIEIARERLLGRMREVFAAMHLIAIELEQVSQFVAQHGIVFYDEDRST